MELSEIIASRRSVRKYLPDPLTRDEIFAVLEAGRLAPSARNQQMWKFIAVTDPALKPGMVSACLDQQSVLEAPCAIVVCALGDRMMNCGQPAGTVDCCIALSFMMLKAWEMGLGTCWLGAFDAEKVKEVLSLPEGCRPIAVTPLGRPAEAPAARPRKTMEEVAEVR